MNQKDLIDEIHAAVNADTSAPSLNKTECGRVLDALAGVAMYELQTAGGEVPLPGLGRLVSEHVAAREGRNPATGEPLHIPAKTVAKFRPGKALKDAIA